MIVMVHGDLSFFISHKGNVVVCIIMRGVLVSI